MINAALDNTTGLITAPAMELLRKPGPQELDRMFDNAVGYCFERSGHPISDLGDKLRSGDRWINSSFRFALTREIHKVISSQPGVRDLYFYGSVAEDSAGLRSDINMILHVEADKKTYETWIRWLNDRLTARFRRMAGLGEDFGALLDCHVVTDDEVALRKDHGAMLTSTHFPLTRLR